MKLSLFDYHLPQNLIAQKPVRPRDHSLLMILNRRDQKISHRRFFELPKFLKKGDVLVFNNSKVFPARLWGKKETGGKIEVLLLHQIKKTPNIWECLLGGKIRRVGQKIIFSSQMQAEVIKKLPGGVWHLKFNLKGKKFWDQVFKKGEAPVPPYVKRRKPVKEIIQEYQTVYAQKLGSVAAPTAGFHFTKKLLSGLKSMGVETEFITLHVGFGTFQPVKVSEVEEHKMHPEFVEIRKDVIGRIKKAQQEGRRIIAVGTTSVRVLETVLPKTKKARDFSGRINTFIYPGYKFKVVDALITNFHLPKSTLLMLVAAFLQSRGTETAAMRGVTLLKKAYQKAVKNHYRFYSFGDAMLII
jgi:S-adenosylmethionine:tRNA ribosyltransferase-isomerase